MRLKSILIGVAALLSLAHPSFSEPDCKNIRLADIGWTDVSATTAVASKLLKLAGYSSKTLLLSLPVTLAGLKNQDIDVYLGNWMPTQESDVRPFLNDRSVEIIAKNLDGAKYTLAVPDYTYSAGLRDFSDIHRFKEQLHGRIYGIEPGNDGNRLILQMIKAGEFNLSGFHVIESSEQGMLLTAKTAIKRRKPIVFLAWAPHPMNAAMPLKYLSGGDRYFGPDFGHASVFTLARRGFSKSCPQVADFFRNLTFTVEQEDQIMALIIDDKLSADAAVDKWLAAHPKEKAEWLAALGTSSEGNADLATTVHNSDIGAAIHDISHRTNDSIDDLTQTLSRIPVPFFVGVFALFIFFFRRSLVLTIGSVLGFMTISFLGLWLQTIQTLTLVFLATFVCVVIGIPVGIWSARRPQIDRFFNPVLDMMQTVPTFVYLIPTLILFGLGVVPGLISTVIFAIAAPIRLTRLGIRSVPQEWQDVGDAFGASAWQKLLKIELPSAKPLLLEGVSQCVMLSLSMVVISALVGAEGLGAPVIRALNTVNLQMGAEAGAAIVILAAILDRSLRRSRNAHS
jgi:glycine betaine/proline transport system substrate-binding protein